MIIGIDFDNTLVSYDEVFVNVAIEQKLVPAGLAATKNGVRAHLRETVGDETWAHLQGHVYGLCMAQARLFDGVVDFFEFCRTKSVSVRIISHKTKHPAYGPPHDLHLAAITWLREKGFFSPEGFSLPESSVQFAPTRAEKVRLIAESRCDVFIDDLPEVFEEPGFPSSTRKILFDPANELQEWTGGTRCKSWNEISKNIFPSS